MKEILKTLGDGLYICKCAFVCVCVCIRGLKEGKVRRNVCIYIMISKIMNNNKK